MAIVNGNKNDVSKDEIVLVDFWAPWCGPCKMLAPTLDKLSAENPDLKILKINVDEYPGDAADFKIMGVPTLILMKDGEEVGRKSGYQNLETLKGFVDIKA